MLKLREKQTETSHTSLFTLISHISFSVSCSSTSDNLTTAYCPSVPFYQILQSSILLLFVLYLYNILLILIIFFTCQLLHLLSPFYLQFTSFQILTSNSFKSKTWGTIIHYTFDHHPSSHYQIHHCEYFYRYIFTPVNLDNNKSVYSLAFEENGGNSSSFFFEFVKELIGYDFLASLFFSFHPIHRSCFAIHMVVCLFLFIG